MKLFIFLLVVLLIFACNPDKNEPIYDNCNLRELITNGDTSTSKMRFDYDTFGRLVRLNFPPYITYIAYGDHQVTVTETGRNLKYIIGNDSLAIYRIGSLGDSTVYQYDVERHLIKQVRYQDKVFSDSIVYQYVNGNIAHWAQYSKTGMFDYADMKYDETLISKSWYFQNIHSLPDYYFPCLGKPNKNLIIHQKIASSPYSITINYTINASGYVTRYVNQGGSGTVDKYDLIYDCR